MAWRLVSRHWSVTIGHLAAGLEARALSPLLSTLSKKTYMNRISILPHNRLIIATPCRTNSAVAGYDVAIGESYPENFEYHLRGDVVRDMKVDSTAMGVDVEVMMKKGEGNCEAHDLVMTYLPGGFF